MKSPSPHDNIDYEAIKVPHGTDPKDYSYAERRAEILAMVKERGSPYALKKTSLADRYDVVPSTITKDFKRLASYVDERIGQHAKITARSAMEKAVTELQKEDKWVEAFGVTMEWNRWLQSIGEQERAPSQVDVRHGDMPTETDSYEIVADTEDVGDDSMVVTADDLKPQLPSEGHPGGQPNGDQADDDD